MHFIIHLIHFSNLVFICKGSGQAAARNNIIASLQGRSNVHSIFDTETYPYYRFKELTTLGVEAEAYKTYGQLLNDVRWYRRKNSNTLKNGRNLETHEVIDEKKEIPPLEVDLDPSVYAPEK